MIGQIDRPVQDPITPQRDPDSPESQVPEIDPPNRDEKPRRDPDPKRDPREPQIEDHDIEAEASP